MLLSMEFRELARMRETDFTRERKVGFVLLVSIILNMVRRSTQLELDDFRERFMPESANLTSYTKQSFSESRKKLSPKAFTMLNDAVVREFYREEGYKTYRGFRLLAIDGSKMEVPDNRETRETYGCATNSVEGWQAARAMTSCLYDLENKLVISAVLGRYASDERQFAKINIAKLLELMPPTSLTQNLVLGDRGYPSLDIFTFMMAKGIRFLMRVSDPFLKEVNGTTAQDETVEISISKSRARVLEQHDNPCPEGTTIKLRVLRITLDNGKTEVLVTDLSEDELPFEDAVTLYFKRWGLETRYDDFKNKFEEENISGERPQVIEQDFHATIYLANMSSFIEQDAQEEVDVACANRKYDEYRVNKNILVGKLKYQLIELLLEDDSDKRAAMFQRLQAALVRNVVPVIPGRSFPRRKKNGANKYSKSKRRCL